MKSIRFVMIALAAAAIIGCDRNKASDARTASAVVAVVPEKGDNPLTMSRNQLAAAAYPIGNAHLDAALLLKIAVDKAATTTH